MIKIVFLGAGQLTDNHMKNVPEARHDKDDPRYASARRSILFRVIKEALKASPYADQISFIEINSMTENVSGQHVPCVIVYYDHFQYDYHLVSVMHILREYLRVEILAIKVAHYWPAEGY